MSILTNKYLTSLTLANCLSSLLHPETIVEGCLYLNVNGLLWSESVMGYYGACMMGYYGLIIRL